MNYKRNRPLISEKDQEKLAGKTLAIVGLGGLGGYVAQGALRLGIKNLILIDHDTFDRTNLNRQLFSSERTLGEFKVEVVKRELLLIDPSADIRIHRRKIKSLQDGGLFEGADLVLDCLDTIHYRKLLMELAMERGLALVHGALGDFQGQVALLEPDKNRMKLIYRGAGEAESASLSFLASLVASLQLKLVLEYFLELDMEKNTLFRLDLREMEIEKIPL